MSKKKLFKISAACAGMLVGLGLLGIMSEADAGKICKSNSTNCFPLYPGKQGAYKVAYEVYKPEGTNTVAANTFISITFGNGEIRNNDAGNFTISFTFPDRNAEFTTSSGYVWALVDNSTNPTKVYAASDVGANGPTITLYSNKAANGTSLPPGTYYLIQGRWTDNGTQNGTVEPDELDHVSNPTILLKDINVTCDGSQPWKLTATLAAQNGNIVFPNVSFAYVTPQFTATLNATDTALNAELNSDNDFKTFVAGSGDNVNNETSISKSSFLIISSVSDLTDFIAFSSGVTGQFTMTLKSLNPEPGVSINVDTTSCASSDNATWNCTLDIAPRSYDLVLDIVDNSTSKNMTSWILDKFSVSSDSKVCLNIPTPRSLGSWYGGVEALVPFVKYDPNTSAQTYIIFYNRRNVSVPVYVVALLKDDRSIVTTTNQIGTIPPNDRIVFTADQLKTLLPELADYDMSKGVPIKFLFKVPAQSADTQLKNPYDPYISGIVVSVYNGQQRSIPLKFKIMRQGSYTE